MLDFNWFYAWSEKTLHLNLIAYKEGQLQRRIETIMKKSGATDLKQFAKMIETDENIKKNFLDYITINVTEFYRNKEIFEEFEEVFINRLPLKFNALKVWSAACSTGAEAYSIAMILKKNKLTANSKIIATDIDETILSKAKAGTYSKLEVQNVPPTEKNLYFTEQNNRYVLSDDIKKTVHFKKHDLILDSYEKGYHAIICRNVTIYFKNEVKEKIYRNIADSLVIGGLFFIGATESVYKPEQYGLKKVAAFLYEKM